MSTEATSKGRSLKDLLITATLASIAGVVVGPWVRRRLAQWGLGDGAPPQPQAALPSPVPTEADDFTQRIERLLEVPSSLTAEAVAAAGRGATAEEASDATIYE